MSEVNKVLETEVNDQSTILEEMGYKQELKRVIKTRDVALYGIIYACPIAGFLLFGYVYEMAHGMVSLAYLITTIGMLFTANSYGWLATEFPLAGSAYNYIGRGCNQALGSMAGWALMLDYFLIPSSLYIWSAVALKGLFPALPAWVWVVGLVLVNTIVNIRGIELTVRVNQVFFIVQMVVIVWFTIVVIKYVLSGANPELHMNMYAFYRPSEFTFPLLFTAIAFVVYNYLGVDATTTLAEEAVGGGKSVGIGMAIAVFGMGVFFCLTTWLGTSMLPEGFVIAPEEQGTILYNLAGIAGGNIFYWVCSLTVVIAVGFGVSIAGQTAVARLWYGMARDSLLHKNFALVHPKFKTPYFGIIVIACISTLLGVAFVSKADLITSFINFGALLTFSCVNLTCMYYFIVKKRSRFNFLFHVIIPLCGLAVTLWGFLSLGGYAKILGCSWLLIGVLYFSYLKFVKKVPIKFSQM